MIKIAIQSHNGIKISVNVTAVTYNENVDIPEAASITSSNKTNIGFLCYSIRNCMFTFLKSYCCKILYEAWIRISIWISKLREMYVTYGFKSHCSHLNFRYRTWFKKEVPWHSGNCRVWLHSATSTWHNKNIQLREIYIKNHEYYFLIQ